MRPGGAHPSGDVLVIDDTPANLVLLAGALKEWGHKVRPVPDGALALRAARRTPPDLILLDVNMPDMDGYEVCAELKADPRLAGIPVIFISASTELLDKVKAFSVGGADYVTKPFQFEEVRGRVAAHLELRRLQLEVERLGESLQARDQTQGKESSDSRMGVILALAALSECRDEDAAGHIRRVQRLCRVLARRLADDRSFGPAIDGAFVENLFQASALHDVGKVGLPDGILVKPGRLTPDEFETMKTHAARGAGALAAVLEGCPDDAFVRMGMEVARSHHEHWDGSGYPDGLSGEAIPLAARIFTVADRYDALRSRRPYRPALDADAAYSVLVEGDDRTSPGHLDPVVLDGFRRVAREFEANYQGSLEPAAGSSHPGDQGRP